MKTRNGFVSNSSSCSFICEICKTEVAGMDICLEDCGFCECVEEHIICQEHIIDAETYEGYMYEIPKERCPICQFKEISFYDTENFVLKKSPFKTYTEANEAILKEFKSYIELDNFLKNKDL